MGMEPWLLVLRQIQASACALVQDRLIGRGSAELWDELKLARERLWPVRFFTDLRVAQIDLI